MARKMATNAIISPMAKERVSPGLYFSSEKIFLMLFFLSGNGVFFFVALLAGLFIFNFEKVSIVSVLFEFQCA